jgi:hypothetical protein
MLTALLFITSCEDEIDQSFDPYRPEHITNENVGLKYNPSEEDFYPLGEKLKSVAPVTNVKQAFIFDIDTVIHSLGENAFKTNKISIDENTGVITYDNSDGKLLPGTLSVSVSVIGVLGYAIVDNAYKMNILDVPVNVTADPNNVEVEASFEGTISVLSYEETGNPPEPVAVTKYSIVPAVQGFTVNKSGKVKKDATAEVGIHKLTIVVETNLGIKTFRNLIIVTVL